MTTTDADAPGRLTDEGIARLRQRIGVVGGRRYPPPFNRQVTADAVRHFANGYGDDNPLYVDEDHARGTRWGGVIAPPPFTWTMGELDEPTFDELDAATRDLVRGDPIRGVHGYQADTEYEWFAPMRLGDRLFRRGALVGVAVKQSEFGGRSAVRSLADVSRNDRGGIVHVERVSYVHAERRPAATKTKAQAVPEPYTAEQLAAIDAAYEGEGRRGAERLLGDDVAVGDALPGKVKGPLRVTDLIIWHLGWGLQLTQGGAFKLAYEDRRSRPGLYTPNALNIPDTVQRVHWEEACAREIGVAASYDYGGLREAFLTHLLSDWMGDDGWIWKLRCRHRRFNLIGDTTWVTGTVSAVTDIDGGTAVDVDVRCVNQRGEATTTGQATVLLPNRAGGDVVLPEPAATDVDELLALEVAKLAEHE